MLAEIPSHGVGVNSASSRNVGASESPELAPGVHDVHRAFELDPFDLGEDTFHFAGRVREPARPAGREHELFFLELEDEQLEELPFPPQDVRDVAQRHVHPDGPVVPSLHRRVDVQI